MIVLLAGIKKRRAKAYLEDAYADVAQKAYDKRSAAYQEKVDELKAKANKKN